MTFSDWILVNGATLQVGLFFSVAFGVGIAERYLPKRLRPMNRGERWPTNLGLTLINLLVLGILPLSYLGAAFFAEARGWGLFNRMALPLGLLVTVNLFVRAFISFSVHLLNHKVPLLWRLHRVHHLDTELDISSTVRGHPLEFPVSAIIGIPVVTAFGLTPWVLVLYEILDVVVTLWTHSNVRLPGMIDRVLSYVLVTPDLHRVHHSSWQPETDSNFGAVFPVWDLIFGTFRSEPRHGHEDMQLGLEEVRGREAHRFFWLLGSVFASNLEAADVRSNRNVGIEAPASWGERE